MLFQLCIFTLLQLAATHSWLHCIDYNKTAPLTVGSIQNNLCAAYPRGASASLTFGVDVGLDYLPGTGPVCKFPPNGIEMQIDATRTYRLIWPAKNHDAAPCTNPFIPDTNLKLFMYPATTQTADPNLATWTSAQYLVKDFKANGGVGFQNCPDFCTNADKAPCFGDVQFSVSDGAYKALWYWEFNPGQIYTHCFDVVVQNSALPPNTQPTPAPSTKTPTQQPTPNPTAKTPTQQPTPNPICFSQYQQCGGTNFDSNNKKCCGTLTCQKQNPYYSQCLVPNGAQCVARYQQCGGTNYNGKKNCCAGQCVAQNPYYSQCS